MTHKDCPDDLSAFLDGELMPDRSDKVARHLVHCFECRGIITDWIVIERRIGRPAPLGSDRFVARVVGAIPKPPQLWSGWRGEFSWPAPALALAAAAITITLLKLPHPKPTIDALMLADGISSRAVPFWIVAGRVDEGAYEDILFGEAK